jgi:hypothetical protein
MTEPRSTIDELLDTIEWLHDESGQESYTHGEMAALVLDAVRLTQDWRCFGCNADTRDLDEYYMVSDDLWRTYGVEGQLCIGCLETRLARKLTPADFTDAEINRDATGFDNKSERLRDRLGIGGHKSALAIAASA